jgi:hypothetical protein
MTKTAATTATLGALAMTLCGLGTAKAQDSNAAATGFGAALGTIQDVQNSINAQWDGPNGRFAKGAIGAAGAAAALAAAYEALSYEATVKADGSVQSGSSIGMSGGGSGTTTTATSTATSTN